MPETPLTTQDLNSHLDSQTDYSFEELLDDGQYSEPLIANGVRCHGGFDAEGQYRSPRTRHRLPAIAAW